ncbi:hypothetical protein CU098_012921, partial [Rhizopus stolonifer]
GCPQEVLSRCLRLRPSITACSNSAAEDKPLCPLPNKATLSLKLFEKSMTCVYLSLKMPTERNFVSRFVDPSIAPYERRGQRVLERPSLAVPSPVS